MERTMSATESIPTTENSLTKQELKDAVREVIEEMIADELNALRAEFGLTEANRRAIDEANDLLRHADAVASKAEAFLASPERTSV